MTPRSIAPDEADAMVAALRPPKRRRPIIAVVGINHATETTDYLMPYGILRQADVAEVVALATKPGAVRLYPALTVEPQASIADFDAWHPDGADYVVVPAMSRDDDPAALRWIRNQATKGAIIIGVCAGAMVVANAGLLDTRRATTHWHYLQRLRRRHPAVRYVPNRRVVVDEGVATTTGISASMPMALTVIEAIAGRDRAEAVARDLGLTHWEVRHDSAAFRLTRSFGLAVIANRLRVWKRERLGIELAPGIDEVSLALVADAWSRTYRSRATTLAHAAGSVETLGGIRIIPDMVGSEWPAERLLPPVTGREAAAALDGALHGIARRYGIATASVVAMQLEYPWHRETNEDWPANPGTVAD